MAWNSLITTGDTVNTPHGWGKVKAVSQTQASARVEVDGRLFDVPLTELSREGEIPPFPQNFPVGENKLIEGEEAGGQDVTEFKKGDKVKRFDSGGTGTVTEVTQRSVEVKWDANGRKSKYPKKLASKKFKHEHDQAKSEEPKDEPQKAQHNKHKGEAKETADSLFGILQLQKHLENKIDNSIDDELKELKSEIQSKKKLEVKVGDKVTELEGLKHKQLEQLITYAALRLSPLLVGMAGTGKTHAGEQVAKALGLNFYSMSVGAQTSKSDIIGYMDASGNYVKTHFREAYQNGGVFLMDEIDAGNANVLIQVNAALSNGLCAFPDKMVSKHDDFVFIASANTYGNGANRQYVGRNQLDAATLDRFAVVDWYIDDNLEEKLAIGQYGGVWYKAVRAVRDYVAEHNIRALISPRATQKGSALLSAGQPLTDVIKATLLASVPEDKRQDVTAVATKVFEHGAPDVKSNVEAPKITDLFK